MTQGVVLSFPELQRTTPDRCATTPFVKGDYFRRRFVGCILVQDPSKDESEYGDEDEQFRRGSYLSGQFKCLCRNLNVPSALIV